MLDKEPRPELGIIPWSEWLDQNKSYGGSADCRPRMRPATCPFYLRIVAEIRSGPYSNIRTHLIIHHPLYLLYSGALATMQSLCFVLRKFDSLYIFPCS